MTASYEKVWPKTLLIKVESETSPSHVFGGQEENVWVASFADRAEAEAWIMASNQFGETIVGVKGGLYGTTREGGGSVPEKPSESDGRGVRKIQVSDEGGPRPAAEFSEEVPLSSRDEVGHWG